MTPMMMKLLIVVIMRTYQNQLMAIVAKRRGGGGLMSPHQLNMTSISVAVVMSEIWKRLVPHCVYAT